MAAEIHSKVWRQAAMGMIFLLVAGFLIPNYLYLGGLFKSVRPIPYISGRIERDDYIAQFRPAVSTHRYAGRHLDKDSKILGLFLGYRSYYSDRNLVFGDPVFKNAVKRAGDAQQIAHCLSSQGLTHLMIRYDLFDRWVNDNFTGAEKNKLRIFFHDIATRLYTSRGYGLYAIGAAG